MNSDPAASSDADSDSTASVSVMRHAKIPDDEEFHPLSWVRLDTVVVMGLMRLMWSWTRLTPSAARLTGPQLALYENASGVFLRLVQTLRWHMLEHLS